MQISALIVGVGHFTAASKFQCEKTKTDSSAAQTAERLATETCSWMSLFINVSFCAIIIFTVTYLRLKVKEWPSTAFYKGPNQVNFG